MQVRRRGAEKMEHAAEEQMNDRGDQQGDEPGPGEPGLTDGDRRVLRPMRPKKPYTARMPGSRSSNSADGRKGEIHRPARAGRDQASEGASTASLAVTSKVLDPDFTSKRRRAPISVISMSNSVNRTKSFRGFSASWDSGASGQVDFHSRAVWMRGRPGSRGLSQTASHCTEAPRVNPPASG